MRIEERSLVGTLTLRFAAAVLATLCAASAFAQEADEPPPANFSYFARGVGWDAFNAEGRSVQLYRLPISYRLRSLEKGHPWGLKLSLPVSFGFHEFKLTDVLGREVKEQLETVSALAGVELEIPRGERWVVKPFLELGAGFELGGGERAAIYSAGLKGLYVADLRGVELSFGTGLDFSGASAFDGGASEGFTTLEIGLDALRPLGKKIKGREVDASVFVVVRRFFDLELARLGREPLRVEELYEIGVSFATRPRWTLWKWKIPRIGIAYRFGPELTTWRVNFGFPFL